MSITFLDMKRKSAYTMMHSGWSVASTFSQHRGVSQHLTIVRQYSKACSPRTQVALRPRCAVALEVRKDRVALQVVLSEVNRADLDENLDLVLSCR